jgi:hypothetical protein
MLRRANARNLRIHAADLLGVEYSPEHYRRLRREVLTGLVRSTTPGGRPYGHPSFDRADHLGRISTILGGYGVEGLLLDRHGEDQSGTCSLEDVRYDIQYVNVGDSYAPTILYYNGRLMIGDWGSLVERCQ